MKIHRPIYVAIENALARIFIENQHAEKIVDYYLKNEKKRINYLLSKKETLNHK